MYTSIIRRDYTCMDHPSRRVSRIDPDSVRCAGCIVRESTMRDGTYDPHNASQWTRAEYRNAYRESVALHILPVRA